MVAELVLVLSAALVAVTVTVCGLATEPGAVYRPVLSIAPTVGLIAQVTDVLLAPVTLAANRRACDAYKIAVLGLVVTVTSGFRVIVAVAVLVVSATLWPVTVTVCVELIESGAVYQPVLLIHPTVSGLMVQFTAVLMVPVSVGVNC